MGAVVADSDAARACGLRPTLHRNIWIRAVQRCRSLAVCAGIGQSKFRQGRFCCLKQRHGARRGRLPRHRRHVEHTAVGNPLRRQHRTPASPCQLPRIELNCLEISHCLIDGVHAGKVQRVARNDVACAVRIIAAVNITRNLGVVQCDGIACGTSLHRISAIDVHGYCAAVDRDTVARCCPTTPSLCTTAIDISAHRARDGNMIARDIVTSVGYAATNLVRHRAVDGDGIICYVAVYVEVICAINGSRNRKALVYRDRIAVRVAGSITQIISVVMIAVHLPCVIRLDSRSLSRRRHAAARYPQRYGKCQCHLGLPFILSPLFCFTGGLFYSP